jgi:hypothetical protein
MFSRITRLTANYKERSVPIPPDKTASVRLRRGRETVHRRRSGREGAQSRCGNWHHLVQTALAENPIQPRELRSTRKYRESVFVEGCGTAYRRRQPRERRLVDIDVVVRRVDPEIPMDLLVEFALNWRSSVETRTG